MPTPITGNPANPAVIPTDVRAPTDGEPRTGASVQVMAQDLADQIASVSASLGVANWRDSPVSAAFLGGFVSGGQGARAVIAAGQAPKGRWLFVGDDDGSAGLIAAVDHGKVDSPPVLITNPKAFDLNNVIFDAVADKWVMVGDADGGDAYILNIATFNGTVVTERVNPKNFDLRDIATDDAGVIVAAGTHDGADIYTVRSLDGGDTWAEVSIPGAAGDSVEGIAWGGPLAGKVFTAVGTTGAGAPLIWTSPDGVVWTSRTPAVGSTVGLGAVAWNGNVFAAGGRVDGGEMQVSPDGIVWTLRALTTTSFGVRDVVASGGILVALVTDSMHVSPDNGVTWVPLFFVLARSTIAGSPWGFAGATISGGGVIVGFSQAYR